MMAYKDPVGACLKLLRLILLALVVIIAMMAGKAMAEEMHKGHEHFHDDFYVKWKDANDHSCCNSRTRSAHGDCGPIDATRIRTRNEVLEVLIDNEWVPVEAEKVRPYFAPDFSSHLCNQGKHVLCLVVGGGI